MTENEKGQHVIFGTGPLGMAVMRELVSRGKSIRMVNTRGTADGFLRLVRALPDLVLAHLAAAAQQLRQRLIGRR